MTMNKKGFELSINTIVILIMVLAALIISIFIIYQLKQGGLDAIKKIIEKLLYGI